jgi:hypothetical protein
MVRIASFMNLKASQNSMDDSQKQTSKTEPKAFDVFSPGKTTPPSTSRPIIVSHKSMAQDPTVTGKSEIVPVDAPKEPPKEEHQQILDSHDRVSLAPLNKQHEISDDKLSQSDAVVPPAETIAQLPAEQPNTEKKDDVETSEPEKENLPQPDKDMSLSESKSFNNQISDNTSDQSDQPVSEPPLMTANADPKSDTEASQILEKDPELDAHKIIVSHHKTSRQRTTRRIFVILLVAAVICVAVIAAIWKHKI